jgi:hypothetical protein
MVRRGNARAMTRLAEQLGVPEGCDVRGLPEATNTEPHLAIRRSPPRSMRQPGSSSEFIRLRAQQRGDFSGDHCDRPVGVDRQARGFARARRFSESAPIVEKEHSASQPLKAVESVTDATTAAVMGAVVAATSGCRGGHGRGLQRSAGKPAASAVPGEARQDG